MTGQARKLCEGARAKGLWAKWNAAPGLGAVLAAGPEAASFLQAQLTSNVNALAPGEGQVSARLDRRGALVSWFHLLRFPDRGQPFPSYLMVLPMTGLGRLLADLSSFIFSEDIVLEDVSDDFQGVVLQGAEAKDFMVRAGALDPNHAPLSWPFSLTGDPGFLCLGPEGYEGGAGLGRLLEMATQEGWEILGDDQASGQGWRWLCAEAGWPRLGTDLQPGQRVLPQTGLEQQVVSTTKGCYLGQEVVARIRTYGSVAQALRGLVFSGLETGDLGRLPEPGQDLCDATGKVLGTWASGGWSVARQAPFALAFLDRNSRTPGRTLDILLTDRTTVSAGVNLLPLYSAMDQEQNARQLHHRAVQLFSQGLDDEAISLLEESLRLDPTAPEAFEALGVILGRGERYHEAIDIFRRLEEVAPDEPMVHTNLSLFYMKIGNREEAERQKALGTMKRFGNLEPDRAQQMQENEKETRRQDARQKKSMFAEVLAIDPEDPLALMGMGKALIDLDQLEEAESCLARALAAQKDNSPLYLAHGKVLQQLQRTDAAVEVLTRGVEVASRRGDLMPLREMQHRLALLGGSPTAE